jgi:electron transfer flavoprotein beta subunit
MKIAVLLSVGRHPASGRACPVRVEAQAVRLAAECRGEIVGLHAGPGDDGPLTEHLGTGLAEIVLREIPAGADPVPSLVASLAEHAPDLILAGRRGQGGEDTGLVPYAVAAALGRPIVADAAALAPAEGDPGALVVDQALPRGERRRVTVRLPALVTVHPAAPPPLPFAYGAARRGRIVRRPGIVASPVATPDLAERPYRKRPRLIARTAAGASAADRLKAATEAASGGGRVLVDPAPDLAAAEILAFLREIGVLERR